MKSKRIDRLFAGVGRIAIASGTDHPPTFRRINAALTGIYKIGRLDVLADVRDGVHAPLTVLYYYERGQLDKLPSKASQAGLTASFRAFAETYEASVSYRQDLMTSVRHVGRVATKGHAVADAPKVLRALKETMRETPVAFNRLRTHLMAFAAEAQGDMSPLWIQLKQVRRFKKAEGMRVRDKLRRPLTVLELDQVCHAFADWPVYGGRKGSQNRRGEKTVKRTIRATDLADMVRFLALTGMRPQEYWERRAATWTPRITQHIEVNGTKSAAAKRVTFYFGWSLRPACGEQFFRDRFTEATEKALGVRLDLYSLRRTFYAWCESARVEPSRARAYLGHGPRNVDEIYLVTKVLPFVVQDASQVAEFIEAERAKAKGSIPLRLETGK